MIMASNGSSTVDAATAQLILQRLDELSRGVHEAASGVRVVQEQLAGVDRRLHALEGMSTAGRTSSMSCAAPGSLEDAERPRGGADGGAEGAPVETSARDRSVKFQLWA